MQRKGGATLDQIKRATKWDDKTARDGWKELGSCVDGPLHARIFGGGDSAACSHVSGLLVRCA